MKNSNSKFFTCLAFIALQIFTTAIFAQSSNQQGNPANQSELTQSDITVRNWVDRTALFTGDRVTYHVEIQTKNDVDILTNDLADDELVLSGLELIASASEQSEDATGIKYHFTYTFITYETNSAELKIDELRIRYYYKRTGQRIEDVAPVGEVLVPAASLVLRSTLPAELSSLALRDMVPAQSLSSWLGIAGTAGLLLLIVLGIPVGIIIASRLRNQKPDTQHQNEVITQLTTSELEQIKKLNPEDSGQRRQCFDQLEKVLKEYIEKITGVMATALTAKELGAELVKSETTLPVDDIVKVLEDCELARYGKQESLPDPHRIEHAISLAQNLLVQP
jgi:hypothetical protein